MEQVILEQIRQLPKPMQEDVLRYITGLVAKHTQTPQRAPTITRSTAFGVWREQVWMSDDFDEPLEDLQEYM